MTPQALSALHARAFAPARGWSAGEFAALLAAPGALLLTRPHAFVLARAVADEAEILTLATDPDQRRRGHGRALLDALAEAAAMRGARRIFLEVAEDNTAALALYAAAGYSPVARRKGYYPRPGAMAADALTLSLDLT